MSTATIATILLLGVFLVLVFLRVPVVYAIGVASLLDFFYLGINPMQMALKFVSNLNSYTLLAVPFFILMGELMSAGGITDTLIAVICGTSDISELDTLRAYWHKNGGEEIIEFYNTWYAENVAK